MVTCLLLEDQDGYLILHYVTVPIQANLLLRPGWVLAGHTDGRCVGLDLPVDLAPAEEL